MNIFVLSTDPEAAAREQCDRHVVKMILESAQMLCTIRNEQGLDSPYKSFNPKHPCTIWTGATAANYEWLIEHALFLCDEYTQRYGKIHKSQSIIEMCLEGMGSITFPGEGLLPFAQCMPEEYKDPDPVVAYRRFYVKEKAYFAQWKKRPHSEPAWFTEGVMEHNQAAMIKRSADNLKRKGFAIKYEKSVPATPQN